MNHSPLIIAIDGGSGAGKSSAARTLATRLQCLHVDTGSHYRAITYSLQQKNIPYTDTDKIVQVLASWKVDQKIERHESVILLNHRPILDAFLRSAGVNAEVSYYSAVAPVRKFLFDFQRSQGHTAVKNGFRGVVMEGRDIGLNIFPETPFKYFLFADPKVKMARRAREGVTDVIDHRDKIDSTLGQFKKAPGAIEVDTTNLTAEQVVDWLEKDVEKRKIV